MYVCTICNLFARKTFSAVLRHIGTHRFDSGLFIKCGINSCPENYKNFESFRSHVYRKHREVLIPPSNGVPGSEAANSSSFQHNIPEREDSVVTDEDEVEDWNYDDHRKRLAAKFLLKTREDRKVTQLALTAIVEDIQGLWRDNMEHLKVSSCLMGKPVHR